MQSIRNFNLTCNFLGNPKSWSYKAKALRYSGGRVSFATNRAGKSQCVPKFTIPSMPSVRLCTGEPVWAHSDSKLRQWEDIKWEWRTEPKTEGNGCLPALFPAVFLSLCGMSEHVAVCLAEGCPGLCNGNGRCTLDMNGWHCVCQLGWRGAGCDTSMETACGDGKDNDGGRT